MGTRTSTTGSACYRCSAPLYACPSLRLTLRTRQHVRVCPSCYADLYLRPHDPTTLYDTDADVAILNSLHDEYVTRRYGRGPRTQQQGGTA